MNGKTIAIVIGFVIVLGVGGYVWSQTAENAESEDSVNSAPLETTNPDVPGSEVSADVSYAMSDVVSHKDAASCWSAINGGVYDLTAWVPKHPGGERAILQLCGTDGSAKFNKQHGGSALQAKVLAGYKIGTLTP